MCALQKEKVKGGQSKETKLLNIMQCCPDSPIMGGKYKTPSKYCIEHANQSQGSNYYSKSSISPPDFQYYENNSSGEVPLPDNDDDNFFVGCRKYCNVNRFYDRTAGVMALVRPCGIIANFTEMYTCESPTQAYIFIYTTFGRNLSDLSRLKFLGYDRSCDLHPFLRNLEKKGSLGAKILLDHVKFMVDLWHCNKHKEPTCMPLDNPKCIYHPKLPFFPDIHGVNTECAEQAFKWLGKFKIMSRRMTRQRFCFFLWQMIELHNKRTCKKISNSDKLVL